MLDADTMRFVREEIRRQVNIILSGEAGANAQVISEDIENLLPGSPTIPGRPVMHPYGFASRAPRSTLQVTARQGEHPGNRVILGHRAPDRPTDLAEGEGAIYSAGGYQLRFLNDRIQLGRNGVWQTAVLGESLTTIIRAIVTQHNAHVHTGNLGAPTTPPTTAMTLPDLEAGRHLCRTGGAF